MEKIPSFEHLSDAALTKEGHRLLRTERHATVVFISWLMEFDRRRLYLPLGYSSLFAYCRSCLHIGEGATYRRIEAARAARRFPGVLVLLANGRISLTTISILAPHLTAANCERLLEEATHKSTREVEQIVARVAPKPDAPTLLRRVPARTRQAERAAGAVSLVGSTAAKDHRHDAPAPRTAAPMVETPPSRPVIAPLSPERFKLQVTISQQAHDDLRQLQNLMRHSIPSGDAAQIVERALKTLLKEVLRRKCGIVDRPRRGDALQKLIDASPVH